MATGYVYDTGHKAHTHPRAPESAERLERLMSTLEEQGELEPLARIETERIPWDWVAAAHTYHHVERVKQLAQAGKQRISVDTYLTPDGPTAALLAASCAVTATKAVLDGNVKNAFAFTRPPGHHAKAAHAMGYCIFNNVAVAASYALRERDVDRVMVIDIDAHHGNGTEDIFYGSREVLFVSLHQHPWYPGTGDMLRNGTEAGLGYNYNVALPTWSGDASYEQALDEVVDPLVERYQPQLILVSAGFDAHWMDHSSVLGLSVQGYYHLVARLRKLADEHCKGRIVLLLEGGYNLQTLSACATAALRALRAEEPPIDPFGPCPDPPVAPLDVVLSHLKGFMNLMAPVTEMDFYDVPVQVPYQTQ